MQRILFLLLLIPSLAKADTRYRLLDGKMRVQPQRCADLKAVHTIEKITSREDATVTAGHTMKVTIGQETVDANAVQIAENGTIWGTWELTPTHRMTICVEPPPHPLKTPRPDLRSPVWIGVVEHDGDQIVCAERWDGFALPREAR